MRTMKGSNIQVVLRCIDCEKYEYWLWEIWVLRLEICKRERLRKAPTPLHFSLTHEGGGSQFIFSYKLSCSLNTITFLTFSFSYNNRLCITPQSCLVGLHKKTPKKCREQEVYESFQSPPSVGESKLNGAWLLLVPSVLIKPKLFDASSMKTLHLFLVLHWSGNTPLPFLAWP